MQQMNLFEATYEKPSFPTHVKLIELFAGSVNRYGFAQADHVYSVEGISPTILAYNQGQTGHAIQIAYYERVQKQNHLPE